MVDKRIDGPPMPKDGGQPVYEVVAPEPGQTLDLIVLGESIRAVKGHWVIDPETKRAQSRLCFEEEGHCPYHAHRGIWMGFLAAYDPARRRRVVWRVGPESAAAVLRYCGKMVSLRGAAVCVRREKGNKTSKLYVSASSWPTPQPLPDAHDPVATICLVTGSDHLPDWSADVPAAEAAP